MEREDKHRAGRLTGFAGFLAAVSGGLIYSTMDLPVAVGIGSVLVGVIMFVAGVELAIGNRTEGSGGGEN